jgi:hypothetical protein
MARTIHVALIGGKFHTDNIASDTLAGHCQTLARDGSFDLFAPVVTRGAASSPASRLKISTVSLIGTAVSGSRRCSGARILAATSCGVA